MNGHHIIPEEFRLVRLVLTQQRHAQHVPGHVERDEKDLHEVLTALWSAGLCVVRQGSINQLKELADRMHARLR